PVFNPALFMPNMGADMQDVEMPQTVEPGLRIHENAEIGGQLTYTSPVEQSNAIQSQPSGGVVYQTPVPSPDQNPPAPSGGSGLVAASLRHIFDALRNLVTLLLLGALVLWLVPDALQRSVAQVRSRPAPAAGYGLAALLIGYGAAFLAVFVILLVGILFSLISLGGLSSAIFGVGFSGLSLAVTVFTLLVSYGSKIVVAFLVGDWIMGQLAPQSTARKPLALVVGVVLYVILRAIPILGWLIGLVVTLFGLGALWLAYRDRRTPAAPAAPAPVVETPAV
ncbi:MAG: NnrS family protein, partial [Chloroflexi bacterium]|nr:NnrS family protein [Chloroflexota bacterium]